MGFQPRAVNRVRHGIPAAARHFTRGVTRVCSCSAGSPIWCGAGACRSRWRCGLASRCWPTRSTSSRYLRHKARYYDPASSLDAVYLDLIREHAALAEKLQAARDFCFYRIRAGRRAELARVLYALLDAYEHALAS